MMAAGASRSPWKPMSQSVAGLNRHQRAELAARIESTRLGHHLGPFEQDDIDCSVAACKVCGHLVAIDATTRYPVETNGWAFTRPCAGDPIW